jgi:hypothetical protein
LGAKYGAVTHEIILPNFLRPDQSHSRTSSRVGLHFDGKELSERVCGHCLHPMEVVRVPDMKRTFLLLSVAFVLTASPQQPTKRKIACKTPENAESCYWTHGRLSAYNGNPTFRLWKIGTRRLMGIYSGPGFGPFDPALNEEDDLELPANLKRYDFTKVSVFGDFEVCPLVPEKQGRMQPACIESDKNLVSEKSDF